MENSNLIEKVITTTTVTPTSGITISPKENTNNDTIHYYNPIDEAREDDHEIRNSLLSESTSTTLASKDTSATSVISGAITTNLDTSTEFDKRTEQIKIDSEKDVETKDTSRKRHDSDTMCSNCTTKKTPLWRRDFESNILCNACGLFLKLHGTSRPIKLKSDIIKTRNRKGHSLTNFTLRNSLDSNYITNVTNSNTFRINKPQIRINRDLPLITTPAIINFKKIRSMSDPTTKEPLYKGETYSNIIDATKFMKPLLKPKTSLKSSVNTSPESGISKISSNHNKKMIVLNEEFVFEENPSVMSLGQENSRKMSIDSNDSDVERLDSKYNYSDSEINQLLTSHEEMIKLKIRIKELELITDLYKGYIKRLNGKCNTLEYRLKSRDNVTT
ncbi:similar to Saccharomyces cerevisiae YJL110C GZF3 GATA zinc finger protein and Dal80p homolog [Maudiozyma saulgeensis]|uniref:Similar to Saccharomyces cerevisiae YJL110C GZF3 GATA zinc finger protein and Dal80p homolog n=1 Tax=Maudiozyma saulgeensis TaxID=1789683 RepID=A0A1X7R153_9SACH|nr:similar to Saccharomyces cerevisiae YJL110C GZF3 GATA zinc finger protein and Dal80p homolog [Kazachstania saulgeensis]